MNLHVEVNDLEGSDFTTLDPATMEPGVTYRWVQNRPTNVARKRMRGYRVCSYSKDKIRPYAELPQTADDTIAYGDLILMQTSTENYNARSKHKARMVEERLESTKQRLRDKVEQAQAKGLRVEMVDSYSDKGPRLPEGEEGD